MPKLDTGTEQFITYIEERFLLDGVLPSFSDMAHNMMWPLKKAESAFKTATVRDALSLRGIDISPTGGLTAEQLACANAMLDFTDGRSDKKKLQDLEIPSSKYQLWLKQPHFQTYLRSRAEALLGDNMHVAHTALLENVRRGDTRALEMYYGITGRYVAKGNDVDINHLMTRIVEVIQRHVTDPAILHAIGADLGLMPDPRTISTTSPPVAVLQSSRPVIDHDTETETEFSL